MNAVGIWFYSLSTKRYLYLLRNDTKNPGTWGLPGGKSEPDESLLGSIQRECEEELGSMPVYIKLVPLEQFTSTDGGFIYHTFFCCVEEEFKPVLNHEHLGYAWIDAMSLPKPLHPGLWNTVNFDAIKNKIDVIRGNIHTSQ
jgi:8-oxo-dGTP pyrophosphatase MutT (NUDIX family)